MSEAGALRGRRVTTRAVLLTLIVIGLLVSAAYPVRSYLSQEAEIDSLERRAGVLAGANRRLQGEIRSLQDPAYIEKLARQCLGMVRPGEIAFVVIPEGAAVPPAC